MKDYPVASVQIVDMSSVVYVRLTDLEIEDLIENLQALRQGVRECSLITPNFGTRVLIQKAKTYEDRLRRRRRKVREAERKAHP